MLQRIVDDFSDGIRADNALYKLGQLYENQLNDPEKAKTYYETLFIDFSNSTFAVEARKRYRLLRGDAVQ
jgi:TolA-binding protein